MAEQRNDEEESMYPDSDDDDKLIMKSTRIVAIIRLARMSCPKQSYNQVDQKNLARMTCPMSMISQIVALISPLTQLDTLHGGIEV